MSRLFHSIFTFVITLFAILFGFSSISPLSADEPIQPKPWKKVLPGKKLAFFMNYGEYKMKEPMWPEKSGLYPIDDKEHRSGPAVWTVDWYSEKKNLLFVDSGKYVIRRGPWAQKTSQLGVAFYKQGKLLKSYQIDELVKNKEHLRMTSSHFFWKHSTSFSAEEKAYRIKTVDGMNYTFDITTGEITGKSQGEAPEDPHQALMNKVKKKKGLGGIPFWAIFLIGLAIGGMIGFLINLKKFKKN